jgi:PAS domain S-box-containing protein
MISDNLAFEELEKKIDSLQTENQTLRQSGYLFQEVFEKLPAATLIIRQSDGLIIDINSKCEEIPGLSRDLIGSPLNLDNFKSQDSSIKLSDILEQTEQVSNFKATLNLLSEKASNISISVETINFNEEKCYLCLLAQTNDITTQLKAEQALKHSHNLMQYIIEHNRSAVAVHDRNLRYIYVSQRYLQEYQVKDTNIIGKHHYEVFPDLPQKWRDVHQRALTGEVLSAEDDAYHKDDGTVEWTRWECRPWYEADNTIGGIIVYTEVITERKRIENEIKLRNEELETFFNCALDLLCIANTDGYFVRLNKEWEKVLGFSLDDLHNKRFLDFIHPDDLEATQLVLQKLSKNEAVTNFTNRYRCKNGDYKWIEWKSYPKDNIIYAAARDITDKRNFQETLMQKNAELEASQEEIRATNEDLVATTIALQESYSELKVAKEKAEESDRLKTAFLANMSHEIRTPMNAIVGFSDFLTKPDIALEKKERFSKIIKERTFDLLRIVEDILDVSKIEVGQMKVVETEFDLAALLNDLYLEYAQKLKSSDQKSAIKINLSLAPELKDLIIKNDSQRLKQVITNLLENAVKFTHEGNIELGCKIEENTLQFFVKDTGIGIPDSKKEIIFDRFRQAEEALSARIYGGAGLGLAIVKGILNLMNGKIWFCSKENRGSTFYFSIPLIVPEKSNVYVNGKMSLDNLSWKNKTILVVEDNDSNIEYLQEILKNTGLNCLYASTGEQALDAFHKYPTISMVLMDIRLPDTNGLILTRLMKKENPSVVVIAQTAYASSSDMEACIDAGCSDYISKPLNSSDLLEMMGQFL